MKIMHQEISTNPSSNGTPPPKNSQTSRKEIFKLILLALAIVVPFRLFVAQPFVVDGASMDPTFKTGQYLIVDKLNYYFNDPVRGSVLIFRYPKDPKKFFIKRLIGLPGEAVVIRDGVITIVNEEHPDGFTLDEPYVKYAKRDNMTATLGEGEYFVMGDNRFSSADSRIWGPVPEENIIGRPILRVFPPSILPGALKIVVEGDNSQ